jgi:O-antigen/teichoic acid export membrane protein
MKDIDHLRNGGWHGAMALVKTILALLTSLLALRILGAVNYGYLVTWMSLFLVYLSLNSNAFTVLVVRLIDASQEGMQDKYTAAINSAASFGVVSILVLFILTLIAAVYFDGKSSNDIPLPDHFIEIVLAMGLLTTIQIWVSLQAAVIEGGGRLDLASRAQLLGPVIIFILLAINLLCNSGMGMPGYLITLCLGASVDAFALVLIRRKLKFYIFNTFPTMTSILELFHMVRAAGLLQAASLLNIFLEPINKFLLIGYGGASLVTAYDLAMKILYGVQHLFASVMRVFLHMGTQSRLDFGRTYSKVLVLFGGPVVIAHVAGLIFTFVVARYWVDIETNELVLFFSIASISNLGMILITPLYVGLIARNEFLIIFKMHLLLASVNVLFSYLLIPMWGLIGAAAGLLFATGMNIYYIFSKCSIERISLKEGSEPLTLLFRRVCILILLFSFVAIWCVEQMGGITVLCVILLIMFGFICREPLVEHLFNYLGKKNESD